MTPLIGFSNEMVEAFDGGFPESWKEDIRKDKRRTSSASIDGATSMPAKKKDNAGKQKGERASGSDELDMKKVAKEQAATGKKQSTRETAMKKTDVKSAKSKKASQVERDDNEEDEEREATAPSTTSKSATKRTPAQSREQARLSTGSRVSRRQSGVTPDTMFKIVWGTGRIDRVASSTKHRQSMEAPAEDSSSSESESDAASSPEKPSPKKPAPNSSSKPKQNASTSKQAVVKRPVGRPRKNPLPKTAPARNAQKSRVKHAREESEEDVETDEDEVEEEEPSPKRTAADQGSWTQQEDRILQDVMCRTDPKSANFWGHGMQAWVTAFIDLIYSCRFPSWKDKESM